MDYAHVANTTGSPIWLIALLTFFAVGIPFFFIFLLGLKILVNNLKSIGKIAKFSLLGVWLVSFLSITVLAVREVTEHAINESVIDKKELNIATGDTLNVKMAFNDLYSRSRYRNHDFRIIHDETDTKKIYSNDVRLIFRSTKDTLASISVDKNAEGRNFQEAKDRANKIEYSYAFDNNELLLDSYLLTDFENKFRDQEVEIILYLPEGSIIYADDNTYSFHRNRRYRNDILDNGMEEHYLKVIEDDVICLDCTESENYKLKIDIHDNDSEFKLDEDGLKIIDDDIEVIIDSSGISIQSRDN